MMARWLGSTAVAVVLAGCGSPTESPPASTPLDRVEQDRRDTAAIERQVNDEVQNRALGEAVKQGTSVDARTTCAKQSETAYKCLSSFVSPPGALETVTDVTCDRDGRSCIMESR